MPYVIHIFRSISAIPAFNPDLISEGILRKLLKQNVIMEVNLKGNESDPDAFLYTRGKAVDFFAMILEGRVEVSIGKENMIFEGGPFMYFGEQALAGELIKIWEIPGESKLMRSVDIFGPRSITLLVSAPEPGQHLKLCWECIPAATNQIYSRLQRACHHQRGVSAHPPSSLYRSLPCHDPWEILKAPWGWNGRWPLPQGVAARHQLRPWSPHPGQSPWASATGRNQRHPRGCTSPWRGHQTTEVQHRRIDWEWPCSGWCGNTTYVWCRARNQKRGCQLIDLAGLLCSPTYIIYALRMPIHATNTVEFRWDTVIEVQLDQWQLNKWSADKLQSMTMDEYKQV